MLAAIGDNCIDRYLPPVGVDTIGGNALNVAVGLAQHGHRVAYLGAVGDDEDGRAVLAAARDAGVDTSRVAIERGVTGVTTVDISRDGDRVFLEENYGASAAYGPSADDLRFLAGCSWVHVVGLTDAERWVPQIEAASVSFDFSDAAPDLDGTAGDLLPHLAIAFFSGSALDRNGAAGLARAAVERGAGAAVVTRGRGGSLAWNGHLVERAADEVEVVDTLGAGDALIAAVIAARVDGEDIGEALERGGRAAARACTHYGAWEAA